MQEYRVDGKPIAQKRHRTCKTKGKIFRYDPSRGDKQKWRARVAAPITPTTEPVAVTLDFVFERPKCHFRTGRFSGELRPDAPRFHTSYPDVDNLVKFALDALNKHIFKDDKQVYSVTAAKRYCRPDETPHTTIGIVTETEVKRPKKKRRIGSKADAMSLDVM